MASKKITIAFAIYITSLIASNTLGIKLMPFLFGTHLSVAIFTFPVVFIMTDIIGDLYGKKMAKRFVWGGFWSLAIFLLYNLIANAVPFSADSPVPGSFADIFYVSARFAVASLIAFIIGEYQDVFTFFLVRKKTGGRFFWLRSNLSNLWSQLLDTIIWGLIAYIGILEPRTLVLTLLPWWLFKVAAGIAYTPLSYLGRRILKDKTYGNDHHADPDEDRPAEQSAS